MSSWRLVLSSLASTLLLAGCGDLKDQESTSVTAGGSQTCPSGVTWQSTQLPLGNRALLRFATGKHGVQVGNGQCTEIPDQGLRAQKYKTFYHLGPTGYDADYIWGKPVALIDVNRRSARGVLAGDVIQYRNFSQRVVEERGWWSSSAPHHTAVVKAVSADGKHICVFEQNVNGRQTVDTGYINLAAMTQGTLWVYRPTL